MCIRDSLNESLKEKFDVNLGGKENWTALHIACSVGNIEVAKLLIEHGANVFAKCKRGKTPRYYARSYLVLHKIMSRIENEALKKSCEGKIERETLFLSCHKEINKDVKAVVVFNSDVNVLPISLPQNSSLKDLLYFGNKKSAQAVSYTHLTLPTICSV
eukprot:TRINITY_DN26730_c0_g1_i1.p1 TRINITY_DN26730_c0_g1~~TRINITY_DN26730_c0_g1_i1.p1  ORF type:complete len:159 (-),score=40.17 TRINITY_DN26730_c0_g1_i1:50-526(-)